MAKTCEKCGLTCTTMHADDFKAMQGDAQRYRWLMEHYGEQIRGIVDPPKPGQVLTIKPPRHEP